MSSNEKWDKDLKKLKKLDDWLFSKRAFIFVSTFSILAFSKSSIEYLTNKFLVYPKTISGPITDIAVLLSSLFLIGFVVYKFRLKYRLSHNQLLIVLIILFEFTLFRFTPQDFKWEHFSLPVLNGFYYIDFIVLPLWIFFALIILRVGHNLIKKYHLQEIPSSAYYEDRPKSNFKEDKLTNEVYEIIKTNSFEGSFAIGLIGTWGHGKSTFINGIKKKIEFDIISNTMVEIHFSPFLNHKEEDVITEFFTAFSSQLRRYSGRLSQSLLDYAASISRFYKRGDASGFFNTYHLTSHTPAFELYETINKQIGEIDKKIIVFIDDLDRLSSKEILQVFKLVRNTSNFKNTFFILALDKSYVMNALASDRSFMENNFIDKFFQLEVFLPEITKEELVLHLSELLSQSTKINDPVAKKIIATIQQQKTLFDDYIKNYRDCVKLANQLIFDHTVLDDLVNEISIKDALGLIFLKSRFPQIFTDLIKNRSKYLVHHNGRFFLRMKAKAGQVSLAIETRDSFDQFEIAIESKPDNNYTEDEKQLLLKTLTNLFSPKNKGYNSITAERNFWTLTRLRFSVDDLRDKEFNKLLSMLPLGDIFLEQLLEENKGSQIIDRIKFHTIRSKQEFNKLIRIVFYMLKHADKYHLAESDIVDQLSTYLDNNSSLTSTHYLTLEETKKVTQSFFEDDDVPLRTRVNLWTTVNENSNRTKLWGYNKEDLSQLGMEFFKEYLQSTTEFWNVEDKPFNTYFIDIKEFTDKQALKLLIVDFLTQNDITFFCSQMIVPDPFINNMYVPYELVKELFGSYNEFWEFLNQHKLHNKATEEFRDFYHLFLIATRDKNIKYHFQHLPIVNHTGVRKKKNVWQVFLKINSNINEDYFSTIEEQLKYKLTQTNLLDFEGGKYQYFDSLEVSSLQIFIEDILKVLYHRLTQINALHDGQEKIILSKDANSYPKIVDDNGNSLIEVFSAQ